MSPVQVLGAVELRYPIPTSAQSPGCPTLSQGSRRRWRRWHHNPLRVPLIGLISGESPLGQQPWSGPRKALVWAWDWKWSDPPGSRRGCLGLFGACVQEGEKVSGAQVTQELTHNEESHKTGDQKHTQRGQGGLQTPGHPGGCRNHCHRVQSCRGEARIREETAVWAGQLQPLGLTLLSCPIGLRRLVPLTLEKGNERLGTCSRAHGSCGSNRRLRKDHRPKPGGRARGTDLAQWKTTKVLFE